MPIVPPPAAIANAIYRAVGVRMTELPMSPEGMSSDRGEEVRRGLVGLDVLVLRGLEAL